MMRKSPKARSDIEAEVEHDARQDVQGLQGDLPNILLLIALYLLQGVPLGLALGTLPYLLKKHLSYAEMATFSLCSYPYSLKLLWSPIVDSTYIPVHVNRWLGRRKSWIVPLQVTIACFLLWLSTQSQLLHDITSQAQDVKVQINVASVTAIFTTLVLLSATQDIAVDGWSLTLLKHDNLKWASACQTIGLNTGYFLSFSGILWVVAAFKDGAGVVVAWYLCFWAVCYLALTVWLLLMKSESREYGQSDSMLQSYVDIVSIVKLPEMRVLIIILLTAKLPFVATETLTPYRLIEMGVREDDLATIALLCFPLQLLVGWMGAKWSSTSQIGSGKEYIEMQDMDAREAQTPTAEERQSGEGRLRPWKYAFWCRLVMCVGSVFIVYIGRFGISGTGGERVVSTWYLASVALGSMAGTVVGTIQFVSMGSFFATISDPLIGGTYLTLLNTLSNFGGTWPSFFVLKSVDWLSLSECTHANTTALVADMICQSVAEKKVCTDGGGVCTVTQDGFYVVNVVCIAVGLLVFVNFIRPNIRRLERTPESVWHIKDQ